MLASRSSVRNHRVRTPTVLQMEAVECGAAALGIVMAHHDRWRPLEELREACGVSRDGSKASNILVAARRYGFEAKGRRLGLESALALQGPYIAFWNFNHFVVVEGHRNGVVYLNDPAVGPRTVDRDEFDRAFTGIALVLTPGDGFTPDPRPPGVIARLLPRTSSVRRSIALSLLVSLTLVIPGLAVPGLSKVFVDNVLIQGQEDWLRPLLAVMAAVCLLMAALNWLSQSLLLRLQSKLALAGTAGFVWHVLRLPVSFFQQRHAGDVANRVAANERIAENVAERLGEGLVNAVQVIAYALAMLSFDWTLAVIAVALSAGNGLVFKILARRRADASLRLQQDMGQFQAATVTGIQAIETLKATGADDDYFARWAGLQAKHLNNMRGLGFYDVIGGAFGPVLSGLTFAAVLGLGGFRVIQGEMTVGTLVAFQLLLQNFTGPVDKLVALGGVLQDLGADLTRADDVLRYSRDPRYEPSNDAGARPRLGGSVELRNVTFGYSRMTPPLIENFSLTLAPGARVALVGRSGSGKSTIARLMSGLYRPWSGEILYDGIPLGKLSRETLADSISVVSQEVVLFNGSIADNLSLWDPSMPTADMVRALKDSCIFDVIATRSGGLEAQVSEGGANFSGGQAQRVEIARALATSPSILIMDEATSALDPETEKRIDDNLRRRGATCVLVAHRLSTIRDADEIIVLDDGKVVERGPHDTLVAAGGAYAALIAQP